MTLTEFLLARIAEDDLEAGDPTWCDCAVEGFPLQHGLTCPVRVLAECEAKRRIVIKAREVGITEAILEHNRADSRAIFTARTVLQALAQPYVDHPDFDPAWSV